MPQCRALSESRLLTTTLSALCCTSLLLIKFCKCQTEKKACLQDRKGSKSVSIEYMFLHYWPNESVRNKKADVLGYLRISILFQTVSLLSAVLDRNLCSGLNRFSVNH